MSERVVKMLESVDLLRPEDGDEEDGGGKDGGSALGRKRIE